MRLTPEKIDRLETMALVAPIVLLRPAVLLAVVSDLREMHARIARLEQRLQDAEGDARRFCGLAGAAMRGAQAR